MNRLLRRKDSRVVHNPSTPNTHPNSGPDIASDPATTATPDKKEKKKKKEKKEQVFYNSRGGGGIKNKPSSSVVKGECQWNRSGRPYRRRRTLKEAPGWKVPPRSASKEPDGLAFGG